VSVTRWGGKARLRACFRHLNGGKIFGPATRLLQLIIHLLLGYRELRESQACRDDPLVLRILGGVAGGAGARKRQSKLSLAAQRTANRGPESAKRSHLAGLHAILTHCHIVL
jgi:hypothetical protein